MAVIKSAKGGCITSRPSVLVTECLGLLVCSSNTKMAVVVPSVISPFAITRIWSSFSTGALSVPSVGSKDRAMACLALDASAMHDIKTPL